MKDGRVRWNSTFSMLLRALKLHEAIELFQLGPKPTRKEQDGAYSTIEDCITDDDCNEVRQYLKLLLPFIKVINQLQGNGEEDGFEAIRGSLWEVFLWLQVLYVQLNDALRQISENEDSHYEMSVKYGKEKLDQYFGMLMMGQHILRCSCLHPAYRMAWLKISGGNTPPGSRPWSLG